MFLPHTTPISLSSSCVCHWCFANKVLPIHLFVNILGLFVYNCHWMTSICRPKHNIEIKNWGVLGFIYWHYCTTKIIKSFKTCLTLNDWMNVLPKDNTRPSIVLLLKLVHLVSINLRRYNQLLKDKSRYCNESEDKQDLKDPSESKLRMHPFNKR